MTVLPDRDGRRVVRCAGDFDLTGLAPLQAACDTAVAAEIDQLVLDRAVGDAGFPHTAAALTMGLRTGRPLTCGHCPKN
ncbi:hypothetical protein [Streptomyces sp. NPDC060333]|uniref:hypothetical protein n=1 Tax=Streptomyces sp. NPDC060333 TaxID=3347098 RepID=UPI003667CEA7